MSAPTAVVTTPPFATIVARTAWFADHDLIDNSDISQNVLFLQSMTPWYYRMDASSTAYTGQGNNGTALFLIVPYVSGQKSIPCSPTNTLDSRNCTAACMDPAMLFTSVTLGTCISIASLALQVQAGNATLSLDNTTAHIISDWVIPDFHAFDTASFFKSIMTCFIGSCQDHSLGSCPGSVLSPHEATVTADTVIDIAQILTSDYCSMISSPVNVDIAGPAVLISLLIQALLVITFCILIQIMTEWAKGLIWPILWMQHILQARRGTLVEPDLPAALSAWKMAERLQRRLAHSNFTKALGTSAVELQEVQSCFVLALEIAMLVTGLGNDTAYIASYNMALVNTKAMELLATISFIPVLLLQAVLCLKRMRWRYTGAIFDILTVLTLTMFALPSNRITPSYNALWAQWKQNQGLDICGGNPTPMLLCNADGYGPIKSLQMSYIAVTSCVSGLLLNHPDFLEKTSIRLLRLKPNSSASVVEATRQTMSPSSGNSKLNLLGIYFIGGITFLFGWYLYSLNLLASAIIETMSIDASWGFGQVVSVVVWAPIIAKWLYLSTFGTEHGFDLRPTQKLSGGDNQLVQDQTVAVEPADSNGLPCDGSQDGHELHPYTSASTLPSTSSATEVLTRASSDQYGSEHTLFKQADESEVTLVPLRRCVTK